MDLDSHTLRIFNSAKCSLMFLGPFIGTLNIAEREGLQEKVQTVQRNSAISRAGSTQVYQCTCRCRKLSPSYVIYEIKNPHFIHRRFKDSLSTCTLKFLAIEDMSHQDLDGLHMCNEHLQDKSQVHGILQDNVV
jgi:hypothetical protein